MSERERVDLRGALLKGTNLSGLPLTKTQFHDVDLSEAHLETAVLFGANLKGVDLFEGHLEGAHLFGARLEGANLLGAYVEGAILSSANLECASLVLAHMEGANLAGAHLVGVFFDAPIWFDWRLYKENISGAHLEGKVFDRHASAFERIRRRVPDFPQELPPANLRTAHFDVTTVLGTATLSTVEGGAVRVADARWNGVNLTDEGFWAPVRFLGDECVAREQARNVQTAEDAQNPAEAFREAVRANRQLATVLREQGMTEVADRFAYRAQLLRRDEPWWRWRRWGQLQSQNLILAGYGYRPGRAILASALVVLTGAIAFYVTGSGVGWHRLGGAVVESINACHGRGIFYLTQGQQATLIQGVIASILAVCGLVIEATFIATFTQRFFGR